LRRLPRKLPDVLSFYFISTSLLGLCILAMLTSSVSTATVTSSWQRQLVGLIFGTICILGIIAGTFPSKCTSHFKRSQDGSYHRTKQTRTNEAAISFEGHHPMCGNFSAHVFRLSGKTYCAGCAGLVTGAVISLFGSFLCFFAGFHIGEAGSAVFWLGFAGVTFGLLQYNLPNLNKGAIHLFLNVIFVVGAFLLLLGVNKVNGNLAIELYLLTLVIYWIVTRIMLSQSEHKRVCTDCGVKSCSFA